MDPNLILQIVLEGLKLANKILETQPPDVAAAMWRRHDKAIAWWEALGEKIQGLDVKADGPAQ